MAITGLPFKSNFQNRYYSCATTTTSGSPVSTVVVVNRCKYVGGWIATNQVNTIVSTGTQDYDVIAFQNNSATATVISSGTSFTTTTGTQGVPVTITATAAVYLAAGDLLVTVGSTASGAFVTHIVTEF